MIPKRGRAEVGLRGKKARRKEGSRKSPGENGENGENDIQGTHAHGERLEREVYKKGCSFGKGRHSMSFAGLSTEATMARCLRIGGRNPNPSPKSGSG